MAKPCLHCQKKPASKPRGLCWKCYHTPGVREQYATAGPGSPGIGARVERAKKPKRPTKETPGSAAKLLILRERARRGESLLHPEDRELSLE